MNTVSSTKVNNTSFLYINLNGVITAIPKDELDSDLLDELFDR